MANYLSTMNGPRLGVFDDFDSARREMARWFGDVIRGGDNPELRTGSWYAPIALWEDDDRLYLELELPGVTKDDLNLVVVKGRLHITAERKAPEGDRRYWRNERAYGRFERIVHLPEAVDADSISAELHEGVLQLTLNKRPDAQPKRINVTTK